MARRVQRHRSDSGQPCPSCKAPIVLESRMHVSDFAASFLPPRLKCGACGKVFELDPESEKWVEVETGEMN